MARFRSGWQGEAPLWKGRGCKLRILASIRLFKKADIFSCQGLVAEKNTLYTELAVYVDQV